MFWPFQVIFSDVTINLINILIESGKGVYGWGDNSNYQFSLSHRNYKFCTPTFITEFSDKFISKISCGESITMALESSPKNLLFRCMKGNFDLKELEQLKYFILTNRSNMKQIQDEMFLILTKGCFFLTLISFLLFY